MAIASDIAAELVKQLQTGSGSARVSFSSKTHAFAWAPATLNATVTKVTGAQAESHTFPVAKVSKTADSVAWTSGTKPITNQLDVSNVNLSTYPATIVLTSASIIDTNLIGQAVHDGLYANALRALDRDVVTAMTTGGTPLAKAADLASIAEAQSIIISNGGTPDLVVLSPTLYAQLVGSSTTGILVGSNDPTASQLQLLGSAIAISSSLTGAEALVADSSAVLAIEHSSSPVAMLDVAARSNTIDVVIEIVGAGLVTRPAGVVHVKTGAK